MADEAKNATVERTADGIHIRKIGPSCVLDLTLVEDAHGFVLRMLGREAPVMTIDGFCNSPSSSDAFNAVVAIALTGTDEWGSQDYLALARFGMKSEYMVLPDNVHIADYETDRLEQQFKKKTIYGLSKDCLANIESNDVYIVSTDNDGEIAGAGFHDSNKAFKVLRRLAGNENLISIIGTDEMEKIIQNKSRRRARHIYVTINNETETEHEQAQEQEQEVAGQGQGEGDQNGSREAVEGK